MADLGDENNTLIVDENGEVIFDGVKDFGFALTASSTVASGFVRTRGIGFASSGSSTAALGVERDRQVGFAANGSSSLAVGVGRIRDVGFAVSAEQVLVDETGEVIEDENGTEILGFNPESLIRFDFLRDRGMGFAPQGQASLAVKVDRRREVGLAAEAESEILAFLFKYGIVGGGPAVTYSDISGNTATIYDDVLRR